MVFYRGALRHILFAPGATATLEEAKGHVPPQVREACTAQLYRVLTRLGDFQQVRNTELFRSEGKGIFAVKARCGLRGYGWFQTLSSGESAFVISHFILKKRQAVDPNDVDRAVAERKKWS